MKQRIHNSLFMQRKGLQENVINTMVVAMINTHTASTLNDGEKHTIRFKRNYWSDSKIEQEAIICKNSTGQFKWLKETLTKEEWINRMKKARPFDLELEIDEENQND